MRRPKKEESYSVDLAGLYESNLSQNLINQSLTPNLSLEELLKTATPQELRQLEDELYWARCDIARDDINEFIELCFKDDETQEPIVQQWFHRVMHRMMPDTEQRHAMFIMPRFSGKSQQMSVYRTVWILGRNPNLRIKIITATDGLATKILAGIRKAIESNEGVRDVFPKLTPSDNESWTTHAITVQRTSGTHHPSVEAFSVLGTGAGGRSDLNIYDDVVDLNNSIMQPSLREKVKQSIRETWQPLLSAQGSELWNATPYHYQDATNDLRNSEDQEWSKFILPALVPLETDFDAILKSNDTTVEIKPSTFENGKSYWPSKWDIKTLHKVRKRGQRGFDKQYLLKIVPEEEAIFSLSDIKNCLDFNSSIFEVSASGAPVYVSSDWPLYAGVDLGASLGKKASYTVMFTISVATDGRRYPVEIVRRRQRFPETIQMLEYQYARHGHSNIRVENNAYQRSVVEQTSENAKDMPLTSHHTGTQKMDSDIGLPSLATQMSNRGWMIPAKGCIKVAQDGSIEVQHDPDECVVCEWVQEMTEAPHGQYSDILMAMWMADSAARKRKTNLDLTTTVFAENREAKMPW